jgi:DNA anti-recombination protein RmuC
MQEIQLLTKEDIVEIVERELRGQFQALRDEMLGAFKHSVVEAMKSNLHEILETIVGQELKTFRQEVLDSLEHAVRQVTAERSLAEGDPEDDYRQ